MIYNVKIQLTIGNGIPETIFYSFNNNTTFEDLLEYIIYLFPDKKICHCFYFSYYYKYKDYYIDDLNSKKLDYKKYLDYLYLSKDKKHCNCAHFEYLKSKKEIIDKYYKCYSSNQSLQLNNKINEYKINNLERQAKTNEEKYNQLKSENNDINQKINYLKQENSEQKNSINILEENKKNMDKKNKLLEIAVNGDYDKIRFLNENGITGKNLKMQDNIIKIDPKTNQYIGNEKGNNTKKKFIDFYDVIIHINSIKDINKGWKIEKNPRAKKNYENFKDQRMIKIGVIGNSNKGKSFLLSKISKIELPSGTSIRTEGLSIKYPDLEGFKDRKIVLLDSAGLETPVLKFKKIESDKKNEYFKEKSREKLITELFLQNYIINNSDVLIAVVGILTYSEQKLIMKIKKEIERCKLDLPLYIIHNLITYTSVEQVNEYINEFLLKSATFNLVEGHKVSTQTKSKEGRYFYEENETQKIFHLIYANEGSEAGKYFNKFTLDFIEHTYQNVMNLKSFDVIKTIKERYIQLSKEIIEKTSESKIDLNSFEDNQEILKLKEEKEIILKKCLTDELGFSNLKANGFEPTYNLYKKNDNLIVLRVEAPGNCNLDPPTIEFAGEYNIIKLKGEKKRDKEPQKVEDNIRDERTFGKFAFDIPLKAEEYLLSNNSPKIVPKNGVFIIEYELSKKATSAGYQMKEEEEI